jgi:hypothetical protein
LTTSFYPEGIHAAMLPSGEYLRGGAATSGYFTANETFQVREPKSKMDR